MVDRQITDPPNYCEGKVNEKLSPEAKKLAKFLRSSMVEHDYYFAEDLERLAIAAKELSGHWWKREANALRELQTTISEIKEAASEEA